MLSPPRAHDPWGRSVHRVERRTGIFRRAFAMPTEIEEAKVEAKFDGGVLTITLPKAERAAPKKIQIK
jgi:HSP20 family protein